ncbi:GNAT family N-acetyltransferase [Bradyrhizobium sp. CCBAU 53421]|uniref:GNAT family N-acetyltransferase n=1 Tax=Bradyrhizobium sp. CCBAU 53421 TaxID=1325120 RepID=UPI00188AFC3E|nr:GNAT family protein [Bradyrhizobium sp. CCBAU 53421]QOZ31401.1 N-acetyltransferase [Bradyrhizobium sp. CCBAU 53421]
MQFADSHAALATDRILLTRIRGSAISRVKPLGDSGTLRPLDRCGSGQAVAARVAATLSCANDTAAFAIEDAGSGEIIGLTAVAALEPDEKRATLAPIWSSGRLDEALLMSHVAHLMTRYAFEVLAVERAEVHLDWRLRRTLELYTGLGFRCEGRLRAYFACDQGPSADAAVLSVIRSGWPAAAERQRRLLASEAWRCRLPSDRPP